MIREAATDIAEAAILGEGISEFLRSQSSAPAEIEGFVTITVEGAPVWNDCGGRFVVPTTARIVPRRLRPISITLECRPGYGPGTLDRIDKRVTLTKSNLDTLPDADGHFSVSVRVTNPGEMSPALAREIERVTGHLSRFNDQKVIERTLALAQALVVNTNDRAANMQQEVNRA